MTKHSPLPWHAEGCELVAADGYTVGSIAGPNLEEDALNIALIVEALKLAKLIWSANEPEFPMNDSSPIEKLRDLNRRLAELLKDPHPGLFTWKMLLSQVLTEMSDYAGHGRMSTFPEAVKALEAAMWTYKSMLPGSDIYNCTLAGRHAVEAALAKAKGEDHG